MSWLPEQNLAAATRRQRILDYLADHPGADMGEIVAHLATYGDSGNVYNTIRTMTDWRELRHEGLARSRRYFALMRYSRTAEECKAMRDANLAAANAAKQKTSVPAHNSGAGYYRHTPADHPIPGQGGQGAVRERGALQCGSVYA